jgi:rhodanese-related sulfurtransferase
LFKLKKTNMKTVDVVTLKQMINEKEDFLLIDVREENEMPFHIISVKLIFFSHINQQKVFVIIYHLL